MKKFLMILLILIIVPLAVMVALYFTIEPFTELANNVLAQVPGFIGEPFRTIPDSEEVNKQIEQVADYLLDAEVDRAVDKLLVAESTDEKTYDLLLKHMNRIDPNRTAKLLDAMRKSKLQDSPIITTLEKIREEEEAENKMNADYIASVSLSYQLEEIKKILDEDVNAHEKIAKIFESLSEDSVLDILVLLKEKDRDAIIHKFEPQKALDYKKKLKEKEERLDNLKNMAAVFKPIEAKELAETLGPNSKYSKEELVSIFNELGPKKTGEVLAKTKDDEFIKEMLKKIRDREILLKGVDTFSENLIEALNIYKEYDDKMDELVSVYLEMDEESAAKMIKTLYLNSSKPTIYNLKNGDEIVISDEDMAIDLLKSFSYKRTAAILSYFDNRIASDIFTKLALPEPE